MRQEVSEYLWKYAGTPYAFRHAQREQQLLNLPPLVNGVGMKLVPIPPGRVLMGSPDNEPGRYAIEGPRHAVVLTRPFYMGVHDVTVGQFKAFVKETGYQTEAEKGGGAWAHRGRLLAERPARQLAEPRLRADRQPPRRFA